MIVALVTIGREIRLFLYFILANILDLFFDFSLDSATDTNCFKGNDFLFVPEK